MAVPALHPLPFLVSIGSGGAFKLRAGDSGEQLLEQVRASGYYMRPPPSSSCACRGPCARG